MAPELFDTLEANELQKLARQVKAYQEEQGLSFAALKKKLPDIGSDKTFGKLLAGDLAELSLENQLVNYRRAVNCIETIAGAESDGEELYDDLWPALELRRCFVETAKEVGNGRCIFLSGPSGSGKSCAGVKLIERYGSRFVLIEAADAWNGKPMAFLGSILLALGETNLPAGQFDRLNRVIAKLNETETDLIVEEAHHLGRANLNTEVTLINQTPSRIINIAIDTLWKKLATVAYEECTQLTGNRLAEHIRLGREVRESDVRKMLGRRVAWVDGIGAALLSSKIRGEAGDKAALAVRLVSDKAANYGRLAFVRDCAKRAVRLADGAPVSLELFTTAVAEEVKSR